MSSSNHIKTLTEAIEKLEKAGSAKASDIKQNFEKDYTELKKTVEDLKPYLNDLKSKVEDQVQTTKSEIEENLKNNPWAAIAFVGIIAFIIGCLFANKKKGDL